MPPLPPVPGVCRLYLNGFVDSENTRRWGNVLHMQYSGAAPSNGVCATYATAVMSAWEVHMGPECPAPTTINQVLVTDLSSDFGGEGEWLGSAAGSRGDDSIPANAAMLVSYVSTRRYRGGHPRQYLYVGGNADFEGAAKWSTAFTAEGLAHWKAFIEAIESLTESGTTFTSLCAVSYISKEVTPVPPHRRPVPLVMPLDATSAVTSQEIASQRRRVGRSKR